jgi:RecA/RadA recombinase
VPAALSLKIKQAPELLTTGLADLDALLSGGLPRGNITEISGVSSADKTSFGLAAVASITQSGAACAWVDISDARSPESAPAAGVQLKRLLWLRTSVEKQRAKDKPWSRLEQALKATRKLKPQFNPRWTLPNLNHKTNGLRKCYLKR